MILLCEIAVYVFYIIHVFLVTCNAKSAKISAWV